MFFPFIVLDMDNNGIELTTAAESQVTAFMDNTFYKIGWLKSRSPVLIFSSSESPCVKNLEDIFFGFKDSIKSAASTVSIFDTNKDYVIDGNDDFYQYLYLWLDKNKDGNCTPDEVVPLSTYGVTLNLDFQKVFQETEQGHRINYKFTYRVDYINGSGKHIVREGLNGYDISLHSVPLVQ